jgi:hypothetical protein
LHSNDWPSGTDLRTAAGPVGSQRDGVGLGPPYRGLMDTVLFRAFRLATWRETADGPGAVEAGIAAELVVTESAVEEHVRAVFQKLRLPPSDAENRRVLPVLAYLRAEG